VAESWLIFVDTNIMLDFYRKPGENAGRQIASLRKHLNSIIVTEQVKMEFLNNRQKAISEMLEQMAAPRTAPLPMILSGSRSGKALTKAMNDAVKRHKEAKKRAELILAEPSRYDPVYQGLNRIFSHTGPLNLKRPNEERFQVREMAEKRFKLGYPPRKAKDTSFGDALNWEWLIKCTQASENANLLIVSRDSDYGLPQGEGSILNDWLKAEFEARVKPTRKIELTPKLTVALKKLAEVVTPEDEAVETAVLEASRPAPGMSYLPLEPRQTTYLTVPAKSGPTAKKLFATLPGELDVLDYPEKNGDVAFALTYPVSYEIGLSYGKRLSQFAIMLGGERGLPPKFQEPSVN